MIRNAFRALVVLLLRVECQFCYRQRWAWRHCECIHAVKRRGQR